MRRILVGLLVAALLVPVAARAQTYAVDRGSWLLGGTAGWIARAQDGQTRRDVMVFLSPSVQHFVLPGLGVGLDGELNHTRFGGSEGYHYTGYGAGPSLTYYPWTGPRPVYPYIGGSAFVSGLHLTPAPESGSTRRATIYKPYVGLLTMLARNVGVDTRVYYERYLSSLSGNSSTYGLAVGISAFAF